MIYHGKKQKITLYKSKFKIYSQKPSHGIMQEVGCDFFPETLHLENKLLLISINFTPILKPATVA